MSLYTDHQYIAQVGSRLDRFKRKSQRIYNFRCPFCGDSSKSKIKARGYFYRKGNDMYFCCHNCLKNWTLSHFLKEFDPSVHEQYIFERYKNGENGHSNYEKPKFDFQWRKPNASAQPDNREGTGGDSEIVETDRQNNILDSYDTIDRLPDGHYAKDYVLKRQIPTEFHAKIYFVPDFKTLVDTLEPENEYELKSKDARIVMPFIDKAGRIIAIQGRSFSSSGLRYITIKIDKDSPKLFGLERVDEDEPVYVLEGPLDSMFLPNAVATAGAKLGTSDLALLPRRIFVFDNECRKKEIVDAMVKMADKDEEVCVWPENVKEKDINDMILAGRSSKEIIDIINANTYKGLSARIAIKEWRRC